MGKSEKLCIAIPVQMDVKIPKPEAPPKRKKIAIAVSKIQYARWQHYNVSVEYTFQNRTGQ
jgi:hypothetical protein